MRRPLGTRGGGPLRRKGRRNAADSAWRGAARRFTVTSLNLAYVGEDWRRRILYEILRSPSLIRRAGPLPPPKTPRALTRRHLDALRTGLGWAPTTTSLHFAALRRFAKWAGNPIATEPGAWAVASGTPSHRRWLKRVELGLLYRSATGPEKILVSLEGFNGLRRVEVLRLRNKDLDFEAHRLRVLGKGRSGGKWRTIPLFPETERLLQRHVRSEEPERQVIPLSRSGADLLLRRAAVRSGLVGRGVKVSHHDLRRTFGRLSHRAGMDLVQLKNLYGHASLDQTVHYIGLDEDRMRAGLDSLARVMQPLIQRE
jgi:integrase